MNEILVLILVFCGALAIGYLLIKRVPTLLHTPLMSMTNAISAVTILGALLLFATYHDHLALILGAIAVAMAAFNVVGGFAITDRMLRMFRKKRSGR